MTTNNGKPIKRRPGAPRGNQNARKHGFYTNALTEEQQADLGHAAAQSGVTQETAILRLKLKELLKTQPNNLHLQIECVKAIAKLIAADKAGANQDQFGAALSDTLGNIGKQLGLRPKRTRKG